jgi:hypothetical protein
MAVNNAATAGNIHLFPDGGGNVGIGTDSPSGLLHVQGALTSGLFNIRSLDSASMAANVGGGIGFGGKYTTAGVYTDFGFIKGMKDNGTSDDYGGYLSFLTRPNGGSFAERFRIGSDGTKYFGNPTSSRFQMNSVGEFFYQYTNGYYIWGLFNDSNNIAIESAFSGDIIFRAQAQSISAVPGTATVRGRFNSGGSFQVNNLAGSGSRTVTADASGVLSASSDSSLKQEDKEYNIEGLSQILQLTPRAYKWLNDIEIRGEEAATEIGFFANEVNPIIPSAAPMGVDGKYGLYDRAIIATMVKAIQELKAEIEQLKQK